MTETSKEYAEALYLLAAENNTTEQTRSSLHELNDLFSAQPEYLELLSSPGIAKAERVSLLQAAFSDAIDETLCSFCCLLCEKGRIRGFSECVEAFETLYQTLKSMTTAKVTSAVALTEAEKQKLEERLSAVCGKKIVAQYSIDPALIGGVIVEADGKILDGSIRRRLHEVKEVITP